MMTEWVFGLKYLSVHRSTGDRNIQAETGLLGGAAGHG